MSHSLTRWTVGVVSVGLIALSSVGFTVREEHVGIVLRFGDPVRQIEEPGLYWKLPWPIERAAILDSRRRVLETPHTEMLTADKTNVILLSFAVWSIDDPLLFYRAVGSIEQGDAKLQGLLTHAQIGVLGAHELTALVSTDASLLRVREMETAIFDQTQGPAQEKYGIALHHVGFKRLSLPEENVGKVFDRMRTERRKASAVFLAAGEKEGKQIRSDTDLQAAKIRAEAEEKAAKIRGDADAKAAEIYADAHEADPEFYRFLAELQSLPNLVGAETTIVLRTDSEPFRMLESKDPPPVAEEGNSDEGDETSHE